MMFTAAADAVAAASPDAAAAASPSVSPSLANDEDTPFNEMLTRCSSAVWGTNELRPMQEKILRLMFDPDAPNAILAVFKTGEGKSHILRMAGVLDRGICLIFIPLLTLSADVMTKFQSACQSYGSVRAYHLDEIFENNRDVYDAVLKRCATLPTDTKSTIFIFLSPQHLCYSPVACRTFIDCAHKTTLRTVSLDELHLFVAHGLSFREECRVLKDIFFRKIFITPGRTGPCIRPRLLCLSATVPINYYKGMEYLTASNFTDSPDSIQRGDMDSFLQTNIHMKQQVITKGEFVKVGITEAANHLVNSSGSKIVIFCNSRAKSNHYATELEKKLNLLDNDSDTIVINGGLNKHEKFWRIRIFCGDDEQFVDSTSFRSLISTNAANVGIDNDKIDYVLRFELPRDLMTHFQEIGRGARIRGALSTSSLYATIDSYALIISQILNYNTKDDETDATREELEIRGMGSAISPIARAAARELENRSSSKKKKSPYALSLSMRKQLRVRQLTEISEVLRFFFLNRGCQHYRAAAYMSRGELDHHDDQDFALEAEPCGSCSVCYGEWIKTHVPVVKSEVIRFFESSTGRSIMPVPFDSKKPLSSILSTRPYWVEWIFDRAASGVRVKTIDAFLFSLLAAKIICLKKDKKHKLVWDIVWIDSSTPSYKNDDTWIGVNLFPEDGTRRRVVVLKE